MAVRLTMVKVHRRNETFIRVECQNHGVLDTASTEAQAGRMLGIHAARKHPGETVELRKNGF